MVVKTFKMGQSGLAVLIFFMAMVEVECDIGLNCQNRAYGWRVDIRWDDFTPHLLDRITDIVGAACVHWVGYCYIL